MIIGVVESDEARIHLKVMGTRKREREIDAVIDTGYSSALTLPPELIAALGLRWRSENRGVLADGSVILFDVYEARLIWDGIERRVLVDEADNDPLVGMELLTGYELKMQVRSGGKVTIKPLKHKRPG